MSEANPEYREPDGIDQADESSAGEPGVSGAEAIRAAMESPEHYRLSEERLDDRDERFSGPRKEQGPPLEEGDGGASAARADAADEAAEAADEVAETPPPEARAED